MYNEVYIPKVKEEEIPKGVTYCAKFLSAGLVGYKDGNYLLTQDCLDNFAHTLKGCPVVVGHQDIMDKDDMKKKAIGYVSNVHRAENGCWHADFVVFDDSANKKIENGSLGYVSCGYKADLTTDGGKLNNIEYKKQSISGTMLHLALVKNPRYNGTDIWKNDAEDVFISEAELFNNKENIMFGFRKVKEELDKDILVNTEFGDMTVEELINSLSDAKKEISEKDIEIADQAKKIAELEAAAVKVVEPEVEVKNEQDEVATDESLKQDLQNSLADEVKEVEMIRVPNIDVK